MKKVVIIGAGLGGLECGYILQKHGYQVTLLEKNPLIGGCFQSFIRKSQLFDTGFHYIGGIGEGEVMQKQINFFHLSDLPWIKINEDNTETTYIDNVSYTLPSGLNNYKNRLIDYFPGEKNNIIKYCDLLHITGRNIFEMLQSNEEPANLHFTNLSSQSAYKYIEANFSNQVLKKLLVGNSMKFDLYKNTMSLYALAQISNSYVQSTWKLKGGGQKLVNQLASNFKEEGGNIITQAQVIQLLEENGKITTVILDDSRYITTDYVISDIDPIKTCTLIKNYSQKNTMYFRRLSKLKHSDGFFTINIILKTDKIAYRPDIISIHSSQSEIWRDDKDNNMDVLVNFYPPNNSEFASAIDIILPMKWEEVEHWNFNGYSHNEDYKNFKNENANNIINFVNHYIPNLKGSIEQYYTSTPLTYNRYLNSFRGTGFGIRKDYSTSLTSTISPKTPFVNLFLTGQNLNLHGMLGVTMSSLNTCSHFIDKEQLYKEIINS